MSWWILSAVLSLFLSNAVAFVPISNSGFGLNNGVGLENRARTFGCRLQAVPPDFDFGSTLSTAVDVFDGSGVDPVVVSNVFWTGLKAKFLSVIIGQFLAAIVFGIISSIAASQISKLGSFVSENVFQDKANQNQTFKKAPEAFAEQARWATVTPDFGKLLLCLAIDVIGSSSELVPVLGEVTDVVWAPIAGLALRSLYGSNVLFALEFVEEILPLTDILPLATICWVIDTFYGETDIAKTLKLGKYGQMNRSEGVTDVKGVEETMSRRLPESDDIRR